MTELKRIVLAEDNSNDVELTLAALEQLVGVFYIAVLISRLISLYQSEDRV